MKPEIRTSRQAERLLHVGFAVAPIVAGADKFANRLTNWDQYLAPGLARRAPVNARTLMRIIGGVEIAAGLLVALKPKIGGYVVAGWLGGIIGNLVVSRRNYDVALRDLGLALGALALARLDARR
jgi:hypothetical protein